MQGERKSATDLRRLLEALRISFAGLAAALSEGAFRLELFGAALAVPLALYLGRSGVERALLVASVLLVLIVELVNSAIEATVDRVSTERHPLAKRAKDIGSAAVMLSLVNAGAVWLLVLSG
ncbi:MAG TPA: diacylglycerol kinase [Burkholderiales bacterium]|jgi:diacylglycerol kinase (ATP)|nr:diacylglycerol kinase [Burkholderiales bacterium]